MPYQVNKFFTRDVMRIDIDAKKKVLDQDGATLAAIARVFGLKDRGLLSILATFPPEAADAIRKALRFALSDEQEPRGVAFAWLEGTGPMRVLLPTAWDGEVVPVVIQSPHPHH